MATDRLCKYIHDQFVNLMKEDKTRWWFQSKTKNINDKIQILESLDVYCDKIAMHNRHIKEDFLREHSVDSLHTTEQNLFKQVCMLKHRFVDFGMPFDHHRYDYSDINQFIDDIYTKVPESARV